MIPARRLVLAALWFGATLHAERIVWSCAPGFNNLTSTGAMMDAGFRFELGVFAGSFVPTAANVAQWSQHWRSAQRRNYRPSGRDFSGDLVVVDNVGPFVQGKQAYIWGFRGDALTSEWILLRNSSWTWPAPNPLSPFALQWLVEDAVPVLGEVDPDGTTFLMKTAAVSLASPPVTSWAVWLQENLAGELLNGPNDDPDKDGTPNLLEFVFGTPPRLANPPPVTPVTLASGYQVITIPRRIDHAAILTVEVSSDLKSWQSGTAHVEIQDGPVALLARDLTPVGPAHPARFLRLKVSLP